MRVRVNGEPRTFGEDATVADVVAELGVPGSGVAVAVDGEVVRRGDWPVRRLTDGAAVEVLTAVQGG